MKTTVDKSLIFTKRDICYSIIEGVRKEGKVKSSFSIICLFDDPSVSENKIAVRDNRLDKFNTYFQTALNLDPDQIVVKVFQGEGNSANELADSENTIRITTAKKVKAPSTKAKGLSGGSSSIAIQQVTFQAEMNAKHEELKTLQLISQKDGVIQTLTTTIADLEKEKAELQTAYDDLEKLHEDLEAKGGIKVDTIVNAGLAGIAAFAAKNPAGSLFGVIPNQALAGFFGKPNQLESAAEANARSSYYDQITAYCNTLTDAEFEQVYSVFSFMGEKKNIALLFSLITKEANKASS